MSICGDIIASHKLCCLDLIVLGEETVQICIYDVGLGVDTIVLNVHNINKSLIKNDKMINTIKIPLKMHACTQ